MAYRYRLGIEARGRGYREATITAKNDKDLKRICDALLEFRTKITILKKTKGKAKA